MAQTLEAKRKATKAWQAANREKTKATKRRYYEAHRDKYLQTAKEHAAANPERRKETQAQHTARCQEFVRQQLVGKVCDKCREAEVTKLCFHHIDPATKLFEIGAGVRHSRRKILAEIAKCVVRCRSCHTKWHNMED